MAGRRGALRDCIWAWYIVFLNFSCCLVKPDAALSLLRRRDDTTRTEAYRKAIQEVAHGKVVLDIGTGALALLAIFAAEAGASRVYAIEANAQACAKARQTVEERGLSHVVHVVEGLSTSVVLPERVDVITHEILGEIASIEGAPFVIRDAQQRYLKTFPASSRTSVPVSASSSICPCEMPDAEYWQRREFPVILPPATTTMKLTQFPRRLLLCDTWNTMEQLDFEEAGGLPLYQRRTCSWKASAKCSQCLSSLLSSQRTPVP